MKTHSERKQLDLEEVSEQEMKVAARFVTPFLEDVYFEAINRARFRRVLRRTKKVLQQILKSCEAPKDFKQLTRQVQDELCK